MTTKAQAIDVKDMAAQWLSQRDEQVNAKRTAIRNLRQALVEYRELLEALGMGTTEVYPSLLDAQRKATKCHLEVQRVFAGAKWPREVRDLMNESWAAGERFQQVSLVKYAHDVARFIGFNGLLPSYFTGISGARVCVTVGKPGNFFRLTDIARVSGAYVITAGGVFGGLWETTVCLCQKNQITVEMSVQAAEANIYVPYIEAIARPYPFIQELLK